MIPLSELAAVHPIPSDLTFQVKEIMEHFYRTEMRASDLMKHDVCHKFVDVKNQFHKPEVTKKLTSEANRFMGLTSIARKGAFVVTSSNRESSDAGPSIILYTNGVPMLLEPPGTPQASKVTIDSITLSWTAPKHCPVSSYHVLYRLANESEYNIVTCRGTLTTCHIKNLFHGEEYEFKVQATTISGFPIESDTAVIKTTEYYDIVLVGETGQGKSTLGNKLLDLDNTHESLFEPSTREMLSVTGRCNVLSNEKTKIRVLNVPGFSDSGTLQRATRQRISVHDGNFQIVSWLVREQIQSMLKVRRIVYFLPVRGPLEKADRVIQDEIKVLHHFFGKSVFDCMVVVATYPKKNFKH